MTAINTFFGLFNLPNYSDALVPFLAGAANLSCFSKGGVDEQFEAFSVDLALKMMQRSCVSIQENGCLTVGDPSDPGCELLEMQIDPDEKFQEVFKIFKLFGFCCVEFQIHDFSTNKHLQSIVGLWSDQDKSWIRVPKMVSKLCFDFRNNL